MSNELTPQGNHTTDQTDPVISIPAVAEPQSSTTESVVVNTTNVVAEKTNAIDLDKIILPQSGAPSALSVQRVNAAAVLEAGSAPLQQSPEIEAARATIPAEVQTFHENLSQGAPAGISIHTYKGDIEQSVQKMGLSVSDMISQNTSRVGALMTQADLADNRETAAQASGSNRRIIAGIGIIFSAVVLLAAVFWIRQQTLLVAPAVNVSENTFMRVDKTKDIVLPIDNTSSSILKQLIQGRDNLVLPFGLIALLNLTKTATGTPVVAQDFLSIVAPNAPNSFVRALLPQFMLGVHSFDSNNHTFLVFKTDSYVSAYAGMLLWESTMRADLSPLFGIIAPYVAPIITESTSTSTSTSIPIPAVATTNTFGSLPTFSTTSPVSIEVPQPPATTTVFGSLPTSSTSTPVSIEVPQSPAINGLFIDRGVENHDARVVQDAKGNILLLWTFIDRSTLVITTNERTLREIISRISNSSVVPLPAH